VLFRSETITMNKTDSDTTTDTTTSNTGPAPGRAAGTTFESLAVAGLAFGIFAIVIAVFALGLSARAVSESSGSGGSESSGGNAPDALAIALADFSLDPDEAAIAGGGTITLTNDGDVQHDLVIEDQQSELLEPGATGELDLGSLDPGDYAMYCSVPGHREAGMEGTISVE